MHLFLRSGIDPDTGEYAGCMKCDFDGYITAPNSTGMVTPVIFISMRLRNADQWLTYGFNFPGCWEKIPDKLLGTLSAGQWEYDLTNAIQVTEIKILCANSSNRLKLSKVFRDIVFQLPAKLDLGCWVPINFSYRNSRMLRPEKLL